MNGLLVFIEMKQKEKKSEKKNQNGREAVQNKL